VQIFGDTDAAVCRRAVFKAGPRLGGALLSEMLLQRSDRPLLPRMRNASGAYRAGGAGFPGGLHVQPVPIPYGGPVSRVYVRNLFAEGGHRQTDPVDPVVQSRPADGGGRYRRFCGKEHFSCVIRKLRRGGRCGVGIAACVARTLRAHHITTCGTNPAFLCLIFPLLRVSSRRISRFSGQGLAL